MNRKLAKILLALGIGLSLVSCAKKPEEPRSSQVKKRREGKDWRNDWSRTNEWLFH